MNSFLKQLHITNQDVLDTESNILVISPTQQEIKDLDQILIKELKKRGRPSKYTSEEERKAVEKEYNKKYYEERQNNKTTCEICYGIYIKGNKMPHENTKKHQYVAKLKENKTI